MGDGVTQPGRNRAINTEPPTPNLERLLRGMSSAMLIAFHKPYAVLSQFTRDGSGNRTLDEFAFPPRVYPIGRLDADSEGLLLLSDEADAPASGVSTDLKRVLDELDVSYVVVHPQLLSEQRRATIRSLCLLYTSPSPRDS